MVVLGVLPGREVTRRETDEAMEEGLEALVLLLLLLLLLLGDGGWWSLGLGDELEEAGGCRCW